MKAVTARDKYFLLTLVGLALLLAGVLLWEWEQGLSLKRELLKMRKMPVTAVPAQNILPEFSLPELETGFPEFLVRPVFSIGRRAFVSVAQADAGAMKKGQFVLVGVLISPKQRSALLRDVVTGKTETVAQVGLVRGMTLGDVQANRVVLRQGEESEELPLNIQTGPKRTLPQRAAIAPTPAVAPPAPAASLPRPPASAPVPGPIPAASAPPGLAASAPRPKTPQEVIQAEKQPPAAMEPTKKQGPFIPNAPPLPAAPK